MKYKLPPVDEKAFALALDAYRAAVQYARQIDLKWEPRMEEVRKSDEFSRLHCRWETENYIAEQLARFAGELLRFSATRSRPFPEEVYGSNLEGHCGAEAKKILAKVRAAYKAVNRTKLDSR